MSSVRTDVPVISDAADIKRSVEKLRDLRLQNLRLSHRAMMKTMAKNKSAESLKDGDDYLKAQSDEAWKGEYHRNIFKSFGAELKPVEDGSEEVQVGLHFDAQRLRESLCSHTLIEKNDNDTTRASKTAEWEDFKKDWMSTMKGELETDLRSNVVHGIVLYGRMAGLKPWALESHVLSSINSMVKNRDKGAMEKSKMDWLDRSRQLDISKVKKMTKRTGPSGTFVPDKNLYSNNMTVKLNSDFTKEHLDSQIEKDTVMLERFRLENAASEKLGTTDSTNVDQPFNKWQAKQQEERRDAQVAIDNRMTNTLQSLIESRDKASGDGPKAPINLRIAFYPSEFNGARTHDGSDMTGRYVSYDKPPEMNIWEPKDWAVMSRGSGFLPNEESFNNRSAEVDQTRVTEGTNASEGTETTQGVESAKDATSIALSDITSRTGNLSIQ